MVRVYESNPNRGNELCGKMGKDGGLAGRPFSGCGECVAMSHMSCTAAVNMHGEENFAKMQKKPCNFSNGVI